jgi:hypothetical protein
MSDKIEVLNVNHPDKTERVDAAKYHAMRAAVIVIAPDEPPGMTARAMMEAAKPLLPEDLFPGGATSGWWQKCVQLDLEARGILTWGKGAPLRFWKTGHDEGNSR